MRLLNFAAGGNRPAIDDVPVADDDELVGKVHGRADVVRNDLDAIANPEPGLTAGKHDDAMFFAESSNGRSWMSNDEAVTGVAGAGIEGQRFEPASIMAR